MCYRQEEGPDSLLRTAVGEMRNVLQAARSQAVGRLIYPSSLTTIGPPRQPGRLADEDDYYLPGTTGSAYYESKWAMDHRMPGPLSRWPSCLQKLSMVPLEIGQPLALYAGYSSRSAFFSKYARTVSTAA